MCTSTTGVPSLLVFTTYSVRMFSFNGKGGLLVPLASLGSFMRGGMWKKPDAKGIMKSNGGTHTACECADACDVQRCESTGVTRHRSIMSVKDGTFSCGIHMDKVKARALIGLMATCVQVDPKSLPQCSEVVLAVLESVWGQTGTQRCQMKASVCRILKECNTCSKT